MIHLRNNGRRPLKLESDLSLELKTDRPLMPGSLEVLSEGDLLVVKSGVDLLITLKDDVISILVLQST